MSIIQLQRFIRRKLRKSQAGQSVVILAIGMVGLLAVVGIAVDISILFVRFNTLRRAVDSAAIAAAGQMREENTIAEPGMAARQFIEFHNLNPRDVLVETCHTVQTIDLDPTTAEVEIDEELCTDDQRKLVRVTAEIESPTVFLQLLGFGSITLRASSISETAVLDVVLILDVSESMLTETDIENDWAQVNQAYAYVPPRAWSFGNLSGNIHLGGDDPGTVFGQLVANGTYTVPEGDPGALFDNFDSFWQDDLLGVPQGAVNARLEYNNPASPYNVRGFDVTGTSTGQPREECRVRFYPFAQNIEIPDELMNLYAANGHGDWVSANNSYNGGRWSGFVPTYNFYGCCNDPGNGTLDPDDNGTIIPGTSVDPDGDFSDLVCQPFKQARDATREFLGRIDFLRGDRVGFVTFDRTAFLIDPDGGGTGATHMIEDLQTATDTLNQMIGVRAEPNFYDWNEADGGWVHGADNHARYAIGFNNGASEPADFSETAVADAWGNSTVDYNNYPVFGNCPFQNAALPFPFSRYATRDPGAEAGTLPDGGDIHFSPALWNVMTPDLLGSEWNGIANTFNLTIQNSYELWASCRGTNIGAALREANNALTDPTTNRREGTVWVMVMLSDGAAGASDPARRRGDPAIEANPYAPLESNPATGLIKFGQRGEYGAFGVCPYGTPSDFAELTDTAGEPVIEFPFCLDEQPETRHFCLPSARAIEGGDSSVGIGDNGALEVGFGPGALGLGYDFTLSPAENADLGNIYDLDVGAYPTDGAITMGPGALGGEFCDLNYDVDDYARDWANFIVGIVPGDSETVILDGVLPTIFTIGFGLNFDNGTGSCEDNVADCLGEELLRYIADVGDNFAIDTNYQQDYMDNLMLDSSLEPGEYGSPGICEPPFIATGWFGGYDPATASVEFLPPQENCGNYFNAPNEEELALVFDEIASRMFTRLAG